MSKFTKNLQALVLAISAIDQILLVVSQTQYYHPFGRFPLNSYPNLCNFSNLFGRFPLNMLLIKDKKNSEISFSMLSGIPPTREFELKSSF